MLELTVIWDSAVSEIFAVKCCSFKLLDQNLEVLVRNTGDHPVGVPSHLDLVAESGTRRVANLIPQGEQTIEPGQSVAFYCYLDEPVWEASRELVMYDAAGNAYCEALHPPAEAPGA